MLGHSQWLSSPPQTIADHHEERSLHKLESGWPGAPTSVQWWLQAGCVLCKLIFFFFILSYILNSCKIKYIYEVQNPFLSTTDLSSAAIVHSLPGYKRCCCPLSLASHWMLPQCRIARLSKSRGHSVKFEFQVNNFFSISATPVFSIALSHAVLVTY